MTFDERLAELGVDLSDLPMRFPGGPEAYDEDRRKQELSAAWDWYLSLVRASGNLMAVLITHNNVDIAAQYIAHLIDIIDRMETRIVNLTGERDWLLRLYQRTSGIDCRTCVNNHPVVPTVCADEDKFGFVSCDDFEYGGVPENWRAYDD